MNGKLAKKLRREVLKSERRVAARASAEFRSFIHHLPLRARLWVAVKVIFKTI